MRLNKSPINFLKLVYMLTRFMKYLFSPTELTLFNVYLNFKVSFQGTLCVKYLSVLPDTTFNLLKENLSMPLTCCLKFANLFALEF